MVRLQTTVGHIKLSVIWPGDFKKPLIVQHKKNVYLPKQTKKPMVYIYIEREFWSAQHLPPFPLESSLLLPVHVVKMSLHFPLLYNKGPSLIKSVMPDSLLMFH